MLQVNETLFMHFYSLAKKVKLDGKKVKLGGKKGKAWWKNNRTYYCKIKYHVAQTITLYIGVS